MHARIAVVLPLVGIAAGLSACAGLEGRSKLERAEDACRDEIRDEDYKLRRFEDVQRGDDKVVIGVRLRRNGDDYRGLCIYDDDDDEARLDVQRTD
ncbi:hypothetical protein SH611_14285 [Geminicoccaceae bacterium 1502E]|nr:hypothetical protein [Geminicoccaceae bacterium 1502E]